MARGPARQWARAGIALALAGYAALALGSGFDRMSQASPELAAKVPGPFRSQALRSEGVTLIAKGDARGALAQGEAAIADSPVDPASTAIFGMARFAMGDRGGAERAFRIAGQLGWRDTFTQAYWLQRALETGNDRVAAMRLDALLRQNPELVAQQRLIDPLEGNPAGRAAMAERLLAAPNWLVPYATNLDQVPRTVLLNRAAVLGQLAARKAMVGCELAAPLVQRLVSEKAELEAASLWRQHCPGAAASAIYDGNFAAAALDQDRSQFAWTFIGHSETGLLLEPSGDGSAKFLVVETTAPRPKAIARQLLILPPGAYQLSWRVQDDRASAGLIVAALACDQVPSAWQPARFDPASRRWIVDLAVSRDCIAHWLNLGVSGKSGNTKIGDIALAPAA